MTKEQLEKKYKKLQRDYRKLKEKHEMVKKVYIYEDLQKNKIYLFEEEEQLKEYAQGRIKSQLLINNHGFNFKSWELISYYERKEERLDDSDGSEVLRYDILKKIGKSGWGNVHNSVFKP